MSDYDEFNKTMQESLSRVMEPIRKTLSLYSSALAPIKSFEASLDKMMEPYQHLNEQFARSLFSPISETLQKNVQRDIRYDKRLPKPRHGPVG